MNFKVVGIFESKESGGKDQLSYLPKLIQKNDIVKIVDVILTSSLDFSINRLNCFLFVFLLLLFLFCFILVRKESLDIFSRSLYFSTSFGRPRRIRLFEFDTGVAKLAI